MPTPPQKHNLLVTAYRLLSDRQWGTMTVKGLLPPLDQKIQGVLLQLYDADLTDISVYLDGTSTLISELDLATQGGKRFTVELKTREIPSCPFVQTFSEILQFPEFLRKRPTCFFIEELGYCSEDDGDPPEIVAKYYSVLSFISVLQKLADFVDTSDPSAPTLFFLLKEKYEVRVEYSAEDVEKGSFSQALAHFVESSPHEANKRDIVKGIVVDVIKGSPAAFATLVRTMEEIVRRANDNYSVFVSEFSFDKIKDEIAKRKIDFILRINKVFSDIQDKILGVPLALIIATTQIDAKNTYSKNTAIIIGLSLFTIIMGMLVKNQLSNLYAIKEEYTYQEGLLEKEFSSLHTKISDAFQAINRRQERLRLLLYSVAVLVLFSYGFSYFLYYQLTTDFERAVTFIWGSSTAPSPTPHAAPPPRPKRVQLPPVQKQGPEQTLPKTSHH
ncbi:hypothetical protein GMSM_44240 [Geomonas sp. Red276]